MLYELELTLAEAVYLTDFDSKSLRLRMTGQIQKPEVQRDWRNYNRLSATAFDERVGSTVRRLRAFVGHERIKWMFGQSDASLDWRSVLDDGCIVLCNLSREKGRLDEERQRVLGSTMLHDLWLAASERGKKDSTPCYVYLDEFQRFVSPTLAKSLAEASGFGLHLTMSHQFLTQLANEGPHGKAVYDEVLGNAQNKVVFSMHHPQDLRTLAETLFLSSFDPDKIQFAIHSTKVMDYREVTRKIHTHGEAEGEGEAQDRRRSSSTTGHQTLPPDALDPTVSAGNAESDAFGDTRNKFRTRNEATSEFVSREPVLGKELSSLHPESLEIQLHRAMAALKDQQQRHFVAKRHDLANPLTLVTPTVRDSPAGEARIARYVELTKQRWNFVLSVSEAQARISARQDGLEKRFRVLANNEPATTRRQISP